MEEKKEKNESGSQKDNGEFGNNVNDKNRRNQLRPMNLRDNQTDHRSNSQLLFDSLSSVKSSISSKIISLYNTFMRYYPNTSGN